MVLLARHWLRDENWWSGKTSDDCPRTDPLQPGTGIIFYAKYPPVWGQRLVTCAAGPFSRKRPGESRLLQNLILKRHAFRVVFLEPSFRSVRICEHLEMIGSPTCLLVST